MADHEKETPGAGQHTGGKGLDKSVNHIINGDSIARNGAGADQEGLLQFLVGWSEDGPWWPTAIPREGGNTETQTFTDPGALREWVARRVGRQNLYFSVNDLAPDTRKKARKDEVTRIRGLHVDVDVAPPSGGWPKEEPSPERLSELRAYLTSEVARLQNRVVDGNGWPAAIPRPTAIVASGGGFQCFWRFEDDEVVSTEVAEAIHSRLIGLLDGDRAAVDVSHIMRLPGTMNLPSQKKRWRGREDAPAYLAWADWGRRFRVADFPAQEAKAAPAAGGPRVELGEVKRLDSLDDLPTAVSARTRALIVNGADPDEPGKYPSRSEALFAVLCDLVRADCTDDQMAAVILDPDFGISAHVLEQPGPARYAARQIERARDEAVQPELRELNDTHAVLSNEGGKCRVLEFVEMPTGVRGKTRLVPSLQSFEDIRNRYLHRKVKVGQDKDGNDRLMPLGKWWLESGLRRQFHSLTFQPREGEVVGSGEKRRLNLWQGFAVKPEAGDWSLMRSHIREVLSGGDDALAQYIIRWMAWTVQNPDEPAEVALVFRGEPGTGKGVFGRAMAQLFGQHGLHTGGSELITGRFNLHFRDCCLLFADEVIWDGDRKAEAKIKTFLTEPTLTIEGKGKDAVSWPNMLHVVISSNSEWIVPAGPYERRYAVFDVSDAHRQERGYFQPLYAEIEGGGLAAMLHDLLVMDLGDWHPRDDRPDTAALADQRARGLDPVHAAILDMLREGAVPFEIGDDPRGSAARPFVATDDMAEFIQRQSRGAVTRNAVSKAMDQIGAEKNRRRRPSGYVLPTLGEARAAWNARPELPTQEWDDAADWIGGEPF